MFILRELIKKKINSNNVKYNKKILKEKTRNINKLNKNINALTQYFINYILVQLLNSHSNVIKIMVPNMYKDLFEKKYRMYDIKYLSLLEVQAIIDKYVECADILNNVVTHYSNSGFIIKIERLNDIDYIIISL